MTNEVVLTLPTLIKNFAHHLAFPHLQQHNQSCHGCGCFDLCHQLVYFGLVPPKQLPVLVLSLSQISSSCCKTIKIFMQFRNEDV